MNKLVTTVAACAALAFASLPASAQSTAATTLVHGIPGVTVDVVVDGSVVVDDFAPGSTADITTYAGQTLVDVEVVDSSDDSVLIGPIAGVDVPDTGNWSIVAMLDSTGTPRLASFQNNVNSVDAGNARLTVRHAAAAGAIDIIIAGQRPVAGLTNGGSQELILPVGTVSGAEVALAGGNPIAQISDIALAADSNTILFIVGAADGTDNELSFVTQVVTLPPPATTTTTSTTVVDATTTTTVPGATTTTTTTIAGATTTTTSSTTTTAPGAPTAVNTGSPIDDNGSTLALVAVIGGLIVAGGAFLARRRT